MTAHSRSRWTRCGTLLGVAFVGLLAGCKKSAATEETPQPVVAARTAVAKMEPFTHTLSAIGAVVARPGHFAALSAPSQTRIVGVHVSQGQRVGVGQPLVEFDQAQYRSAANAAQAALVAAQRNYDRASRLAGEGIVPRSNVDAATAEVARTRNDYVIARRALQLSVLRSPVRGVVTRMTAVLGAPADPTLVLVEVADPSAFDVALNLGPTEAGAIRPGARVTLSAGEQIGGESLGGGNVASIGAAVDTGSRAVQVRVNVTTPTRALRLGESIYGVIAVETRPNAVVVPVEALVPGDTPGSYKVFVVDRNATAHEREVKVGERTETMAEILAGLNGGETIVTQGAYGVADSAKVSKPTSVKQ